MPDLRRVGSPPDRPVLVFDGDCGFCRIWIGRWRHHTGETVEYQPFQDPDISRRLTHRVFLFRTGPWMGLRSAIRHDFAGDRFALGFIVGNWWSCLVGIAGPVHTALYLLLFNIALV